MYTYTKKLVGKKCILCKNLFAMQNKKQKEVMQITFKYE